MVSRKGEETKLFCHKKGGLWGFKKCLCTCFELLKTKHTHHSRHNVSEFTGRRDPFRT
jgi:hypothetical protein